MQKKRASSAGEDGICILCGNTARGTPAKADIVILAARKLRALLRMPPRRTITCENCANACIGKSAAFQKRLMRYRLAAGLFFLLVSASGIFFQSAGLWTVLPAAIGALLIALFAYAGYFPEFG